MLEAENPDAEGSSLILINKTQGSGRDEQSQTGDQHPKKHWRAKAWTLDTQDNKEG